MLTIKISIKVNESIMLEINFISRVFVICVALFMCRVQCTKNKITKENLRSSLNDDIKEFQEATVASNANPGNSIGDLVPENVHTPKNIDEILPKFSSKKGHVLLFHHSGTKSHVFFMKSLAEGLLEYEHKVTTVFYVKTNIIHQNYTEILIKDRSDEIYTKLSKLVLEHGGSTLSPSYIYRAFNLFIQDYPRICSDSIMESEIIMKMIKETTKLDTVITMSTCGAYIAHLLDTPIIFASPVAPLTIFLGGLGDPVNLFAHPVSLLTSIEPLSFFDRIKNVLSGNMWNALIYHLTSLEKPILEEMFGNNLPDYRSIVKERSAFGISNSHFVTHGSWPYYKNLVEVGGIHLKPGRPLPSDLQKYMDSHPEGVVYVSFGSAFKPSEMKQEQKLAFLGAFRKLNIPIIWKWNDDDLSGIPKNVRVEKWLPQNDLLAHPNLKVFVTHGGLLSVQEALYHSIPLVGVPLANDQISNVIRAEKNGFAIKILLENLSEDSLFSAVRKAMDDQEIRDSMEKMHTLFVEQTGETPMEKGVKAVEYVIKHKYCDHLKPKTLEMRWYERHGYDIFTFLLIIIVSITFISFKILTCCVRKCCYKKTKQD